MLYHLLYPLRDVFSGFNVMRYITFRATMAAVTAMILGIALGPYVIRKLYELKAGAPLRDEKFFALHSAHKKKDGVPTMGGILILISIIVPTLLWVDLLNINVIIILAATLWLGVLGGIDDLAKVRRRESSGISARKKFFWQILLGVLVGAVLVLLPEKSGFSTKLSIPFWKRPLVNLGVGYIVFVTFVIVGTSNAVNLTDGLDGLAIGCSIVAALVYGIICYLSGHASFAQYLNIQHVPGSGELAVFCAAMLGAGLAFLWYNAYPAEVFMGDTGSLALGGAVGVMAVLVKKELLLLIVGGVFVIEATSVILQVFSYKTWKKRIFLMTPIHHHFELKGWPETKVTTRFWIVAVVFALLSLATLKLQ
jgi:phospho-N-acetylmuramoyl-pentapeptide-transferase